MQRCIKFEVVAPIFLVIYVCIKTNPPYLKTTSMYYYRTQFALILHCNCELTGFSCNFEDTRFYIESNSKIISMSQSIQLTSDDVNEIFTST